MDINELEEILSILKRNDITEFELQQDGTHIKLSRGGVQQFVSVPVAQAATVEPAIVSVGLNGRGAHSTEAKPGAAIAADHLVKVESPIVGTFYRKPSPDSEPFVKVGDKVEKGDTLCIVEAMKLMNEIESPCSGKVQEVFLSDGEVVEFGEVILLINPEA